MAPASPLRLTLAALLLACKPTAAPPTQASEPERTPPAPAAPLVCADASCWLTAATTAAAAGQLDLASALHGRAFAADPTPARLVAWIDDLRTTGQLRRAQVALAEARLAAQTRDDVALIAAIDEQLATLPPTAPSATPIAAPLSPALREAYALALAGGVHPAALAFQALLRGETRPAVLADAADAITDLAPRDADLRAWARATRARARVLLYEQGAARELLPVETWMVRGAAWHGDKLVLLRNVGVLGTPGLRLGLISIAAPEPGATQRRLFAPEPADALALTSDGAALIRGEGSNVVVQQLASGESSPPIAAGERSSQLLALGGGEALRTLGIVERSAVLWDAAGRRVLALQLDGTTPTITRAYTGEGAYHHNFLHDSPTWPVSLAVNDDASLIAVGGSDSRVFVFDGAGRRKHVLKFSWDYVEHRDMGGNPDLNQPIALHLAGPHELLAIHNHGDLIRWDLRTGKSLKHFPRGCDDAEATTLANRFKGPDSPPQTPTAEQRQGCGAARSAAFSPDGSMVATGGVQGVRVRDTGSGAGLAMLVATDLPDDILTFAADGTLAMVDLYGAVATWRRGEAVQRRVPPRPSGTVEPLLARDGSTLYFNEGTHDHLWDLHARQPIAIKRATGERVLAVAPDGRRVVVRTSTGVELRNAATGARSYHAPSTTGVHVHAHFTPGAHVLLDIQDSKRSLIHVDPQGRGRPLAIAPDGHSLQLSDDGQLLAGLDSRGPAKVWRTDTGALAQTLTTNTRNLTLARDGSAVAWLELPDPDKPKTRAHLRRITGAATDEQTLDLDGWPAAIALSHDGAELLILIQSGKLWRWRPGGGPPRLREELGLYGAQRVTVSDDGRLLLLASYGHVDIRRNDEPLTPLATVHALVDGGWLAISRGGAVDGSPDAVASLVTRVTRGDRVQIFGGELGWDAAHVDGLVTRALLGEDVAPPVPAR